MVYRNLGAQRAVIDLNGDHHELWTIAVRPTDGSPSPARISPVCATLRRQLSSAEFLVLGPVSLHGVCAVDLSRKSAGYRGVPAFAGAAALSLGHSRHCLAQHSGRCQRKPRLAHLCRFRCGLDCRSAATLRSRGAGAGLGQHRIRLGLHHRRSVHDDVPLGALQVGPARPEVAHVAGSAWLPFPHLFALPRRRCTMSISWTHSRPRPARST